MHFLLFFTYIIIYLGIFVWNYFTGDNIQMYNKGSPKNLNSFSEAKLELFFVI